MADQQPKNRLPDWQAEWTARLRRPLPVLVEGYDGPVYLVHEDRYYPDDAAAFDATWDDGFDPSTALVHTCTVGPAFTPIIAQTVHEAWFEEVGDDFDSDLPPDIQAACDELQERLEKAAPIVWNARPHERIQLPSTPDQMYVRSASEAV